MSTLCAIRGSAECTESASDLRFPTIRFSHRWIGVEWGSIGRFLGEGLSFTTLAAGVVGREEFVEVIDGTEGIERAQQAIVVNVNIGFWTNPLCVEPSTTTLIDDVDHSDDIDTVDTSIVIDIKWIRGVGPGGDVPIKAVICPE